LSIGKEQGLTSIYLAEFADKMIKEHGNKNNPREGKSPTDNSFLKIDSLPDEERPNTPNTN
jgi:hypothetical protein